MILEQKQSNKKGGSRPGAGAPPKKIDWCEIDAMAEKQWNQKQLAALADCGEQWRKRFACLDGLSGRPSIETCVEQAMSHESRHKYATSKVWCEIWLQNAARQWLVAFNREQNAPATDPSLDAEAKARRSQAESERSRRYYSQSGPLPSSNRNMVPPELQAQVDQIIAENQPGFTDKLMWLVRTLQLH